MFKKILMNCRFQMLYIFIGILVVSNASCPSIQLGTSNTWRISIRPTTKFYLEKIGDLSGFYSLATNKVKQGAGEFHLRVHFLGSGQVNTSVSPTALGFQSNENITITENTISSELTSETVIYGNACSGVHYCSWNVTFVDDSPVCVGFGSSDGSSVFEICPYLYSVVPEYLVMSNEYCLEYDKTSTTPVDLQCANTCLTCDGPVSEMCTSCVPEKYSYFDQPYKCENSCYQYWYYGNTSDYMCYPCNSACQICTGPTNNDCTHCAQGYFLQPQPSTTCLPTCPSNTYSDSSARKCVECYGTCATCMGTSNNCTSCVSGYFMHGSGCVAVCPDGYYGDTTNSLCVLCDSACKTCIGPGAEQCSSCNRGLGYYLQPDFISCNKTCPDGYYGGSIMCIACPMSCKTCSSPGLSHTLVSYDKCTSCNPGYFLGLIDRTTDERTCDSTCPDGYYGNPTTNTCEICDSACTICRNSSANSCTSCSPGYYLDPRTSLGCLQKCPPGYWELSLNCQLCHSSCLTCTEGPTNTNCLSCKPTFFLQPDGKTCLTSCPQGYFKDTTNNLCVACNSACSTCFGPEANQCYSCNSNYFLQSSESTTCLTSCDSSPNTWTDSVNRRCQPCDVSCMTCNGSGKTKCLSCNTNYLLQPNSITCEPTCPIGYWKDATIRTCNPCIPPCLTCTNREACLTCQAGYQVDFSSKQCVESCPGGYYPDNGCQPCHLACSTCFGPTTSKCLSCNPGFFLLDSTTSCLTSCDSVPGYWSNSSLWICSKCGSGCARCENEQTNNCSACLPGYYFDNTTNACGTSCPDGFYTNNETLRCIPCPETCETCSGSDTQNVSCLSCSSGYYLQLPPHPPTCLTTCLDPTFCPNSSDNSCSPCNLARQWAVWTFLGFLLGYVLLIFLFGKSYGNYSIFTKLIEKRRQNVSVKPHTTYKLLMIFLATHPLTSIFLYNDKDFSKRIGCTLLYIRIMMLFILAAGIHQVEDAETVDFALQMKSFDFVVFILPYVVTAPFHSILEKFFRYYQRRQQDNIIKLRNILRAENKIVRKLKANFHLTLIIGVMLIESIVALLFCIRYNKNNKLTIWKANFLRLFLEDLILVSVSCFTINLLLIKSIIDNQNISTKIKSIVRKLIDDAHYDVFSILNKREIPEGPNERQQIVNPVQFSETFLKESENESRKTKTNFISEGEGMSDIGSSSSRKELGGSLIKAELTYMSPKIGVSTTRHRRHICEASPISREKKIEMKEEEEIRPQECDEEPEKDQASFPERQEDPFEIIDPTRNYFFEYQFGNKLEIQPSNQYEDSTVARERQEIIPEKIAKNDSDKLEIFAQDVILEVDMLEKRPKSQMKRKKKKKKKAKKKKTLDEAAEHHKSDEIKLQIKRQSIC